MIDRIKLTASAKNQLITIKRRTGIDHYNSICRHALCMSIASPSELVIERLVFAGGLEIDWSILTGGNEDLYINIVRSGLKGKSVDNERFKEIVTAHIHRGLSYIFSKPEHELFSLSSLGDG